MDRRRPPQDLRQKREPNGKTVLIIDDDREIVTTVRMMLESRGFTVSTASDGNAGLAVAQRDNPDLVIVDMMMPKKSGFLVIEKLKQTPTSGPPVIMITANEGNRHKAYAEMLGVNVYLRKPFAMEVLLEEVEKLTLGARQ
jgi:DNA-binding response OmpR family regulator